MADIYYFDISKKGKDLLGSGDVPLLTNEQAVKESIHNLLLTNVGEKVYDVTYGINLDRYFFSPVDEYTSQMMQYDIQEGLLRQEERISNLEVIVTPYPDENGYDITINFSVIFSNTPQTFQVKFNRIR